VVFHCAKGIGKHHVARIGDFVLSLRRRRQHDVHGETTTILVLVPTYLLRRLTLRSVVLLSGDNGADGSDGMSASSNVRL
jgi:hypothetical protein